MHEYGTPVSNWQGIKGVTRMVTPTWSRDAFLIADNVEKISEELAYFFRVANTEFKCKFLIPETDKNCCLNAGGMRARIASIKEFDFDYPMPAKEGETYIHTPEELQEHSKIKLSGIDRRVHLTFDPHGINRFRFEIVDSNSLSYGGGAHFYLKRKEGLLWVLCDPCDANLEPRTFLQHEVDFLEHLASLR